MKKKLLFVIPAFQTGGTISSLNNIYRSYKDRCEISVFAITTQGNASVEFNGRIIKEDSLLSYYFGNFDERRGLDCIPAFLMKICRRMGYKYGWNLEQLLLNRAARNLTNNYGFDTVIGFQEGIANTLASLVQCNCKIAWIHCNYRYYPGAGKEENIYSRFNQIVCVSDFTASEFCDIYPSLSAKTIPINNLFDVSRVETLAEEDIDDKRFSNDRFTIVSIGRIASVKRFERIPEIAHKLVSLGANFRWYILGDGEEGIKKEIRDGIERYGLEDFIIPLGNKKNPYPYLAKADLYVCLSESEACPMVFIEAKTLGVPIITTDFGSAREFVKDGKDGYVVPLDSLPETLCEYLSDVTTQERFKTEVALYESPNKTIERKLDNILL